MLRGCNNLLQMVSSTKTQISSCRNTHELKKKGVGWQECPQQICEGGGRCKQSSLTTLIMNCNALHPFVYYYYYCLFWSGWGLGTTYDYEQSTGSHNNTKLLTNEKLITGRLTKQLGGNQNLCTKGSCSSWYLVCNWFLDCIVQCVTCSLMQRRGVVINDFSPMYLA
jgi:hypothetical protein